jgi:hypothetical protein
LGLSIAAMGIATQAAREPGRAFVA